MYSNKTLITHIGTCVQVAGDSGFVDLTLG